MWHFDLRLSVQEIPHRGRLNLRAYFWNIVTDAVHLLSRTKMTRSFTVRHLHRTKNNHVLSFIAIFGSLVRKFARFSGDHPVNGKSKCGGAAARLVG